MSIFLIKIDIVFCSNARYYELLLAVSRQGSVQAWQDGLLFMLQAVHETAQWTLRKVGAIRELMGNTRTLFR
jgi:hypothetical protein